MSLQHAVDTYRGHTIPHVRWVEHRNRWFAISGVLILLSLGGLLFRHLNFSIDFEGGAQISYTFAKPVEAADVSAVLEEHGIEDAEVQIVNGEGTSPNRPGSTR